MTFASRLARRASLVLIAIFALPMGVAMADANATTVIQSVPWQAWIIGFVLAALGGIETIVRGVRMLLTIIAPRTKTTADDSALDVVAKVDDRMQEWIDALHGIVPALPAIAKPTPAPPPVPRRIPPIPGVLLALALAGAALQPACSSPQRGAAKTAAVECAKADLVPILVLVAQWAIESVRSGSVNWPAVEADAIAHGEIIGYCAADRFVAGIEPKQTAGVLPNPGPGSAMLERIRVRYPGVEWR